MIKILVSKRQLEIIYDAVEWVWDDPVMNGYYEKKDFRTIDRLYHRLNKIINEQENDI